jgi:hypothetical protein
MTDDRFKEIMSRLGMPNSVSLLTALQQMANEVGQEVQKNTAMCCVEIAESEMVGANEHDCSSDQAIDVTCRIIAEKIRCRFSV